MTVLRNVVGPISNRTDGNEAARALRSHRGELHRATLSHVVQTGTGGIDRAPMDERRSDARAVRSRGGGRTARLLSGNTTTRPVSDPTVPVFSLAAGERPTTETGRRADPPVFGRRR